MNDIYIYGDIVKTMEHFEDTSAAGLTYDLKFLDGRDVTLHVNSAGGDVFAALAIYNALKSYQGNVTVSIDGLAASAASLIAMGGSRVTMASNALMMIHLPSAGLAGYFDTKDLSKLQEQLAAVEQSLIAVYSTRISEADARRMMQAETWLSAQEALDIGLIDEITDDVPLAIDNKHKVLFVNKLAVSTKNFDADKLRRAMEAKTMDEQKIIAQVRQQELSRIRDLQALRCDNAAVNAIVDVALSDGRAVADVQNYIDAVKKIPAPEPAPAVNDVADKIVAVIRDQLTSGAENVTSQPTATPEDVRKEQGDRIVNIANGMI